MAHPENSLQPFSTELAPTAWMQIAQLPQETYLALMERLRALANLATQGRHPIPLLIGGAEAEASLSFVAGDLAALYEVDFHRRVVRLLEVARRLPTEPFKAQGEVPDDRVTVR